MCHGTQIRALLHRGVDCTHKNAQAAMSGPRSAQHVGGQSEITAKGTALAISESGTG